MGNVTIFLGTSLINIAPCLRMTRKLSTNGLSPRGIALTPWGWRPLLRHFVKFAQTFTDIGHLGNGIFIEGGWKGVGKDALRAVNLVGSAGAILGRAGQMLRVIQMSESGVCTFSAQANALRLTGTRFFITGEELIRKIGGNLEQIN
jgi:hypothetical protein